MARVHILELDLASVVVLLEIAVGLGLPLGLQLYCGLVHVTVGRPVHERILQAQLSVA